MTTTGNLAVAAVPSREAPARAGADQAVGSRPLLRAAVTFLVLLNTTAIYGQASWFRAHLSGLPDGPAGWVVPVGVSLAIEMIGVYLMAMAHAAIMANQSAATLLFGGYSIGLTMGALNYSHFAPTGRPNPSAATFGLLSAISPWLWRIYSRYVHRARLAELGQLDARGVRLGLNRQIWHPIKSLRVRSFAAWEGITSPEDAVRGWELMRGCEDAPVSPAPAAKRTAAEWVAMAESVRAAEPSLSWPEVAQRIGCSDRHLRTCRKSITKENADV